MIYVVVIVHLLVAVALVISILLQSGQGGGLAGSLGGTSGGVGSVFGGRGAGETLVKITTVLAIVFVVLTVAINLVAVRPSSTANKSVIPVEAQKTGTTQGSPPGETPMAFPEGD